MSRSLRGLSASTRGMHTTRLYHHPVYNIHHVRSLRGHSASTPGMHTTRLYHHPVYNIHHVQIIQGTLSQYSRHAHNKAIPSPCIQHTPCPDHSGDTQPVLEACTQQGYTITLYTTYIMYRSLRGHSASTRGMHTTRVYHHPVYNIHHVQIIKGTLSQYSRHAHKAIPSPCIQHTPCTDH